MNDLVLNSHSEALTMSTREIASLLGKQHSHIKVSAKRLAEKGTIALRGSKFEHSGNVYEEYLLQKRDCLILVAQNSPEFTAAIVDRWQELEEQNLKPKLPTSYIEALEELVESEKQKQIALAEVSRLQEVCETISSQFKPGMTPSAFCKLLNGVNTQKVNAYLVSKKLIRKTNYGYRSMPAYRDRLFADRTGETDYGRHAELVTLTVEGAKRIYKMYLNGELEMKKGWDGKFTHDLFSD